jgi:hypothetical protein
VKQALLIAGSVVLLSLVPAAAADISVLGGTVVVHTTGDLGVSALGDPVARVATSAPTCPGEGQCVVVYGDPAGLSGYQAYAYVGPCPGLDPCVIAYAAPPGVGFMAVVFEGPAGALVCPIVAILVDCVYVVTDPLCVGTWTYIGPIVCET